MEGEKAAGGEEEKEQPKLRSWARNRQASPASSPSSSSGGSGERSWVKMRQQGVNSLEDLATKYHRMKQQQEEEIQSKGEVTEAKPEGAKPQETKVEEVARPVEIEKEERAAKKKREEPDKSSLKKQKKEKKEQKKRKLKHDKEEELELSEAENQEIEAEIKRLERQAEEVQKQIEEEEQELDEPEMQSNNEITIEEVDATPEKDRRDAEEAIISRLCKIFDEDGEDEQIRKIVIDTFIGCEQNEEAARLVLLKAREHFDKEIEEHEYEEEVYYECNNCNRDIHPGEFRYHCTKCEDFDLCSSCLSKHNTSGNPIHDRDHFFEEIEVESDEDSESDEEHEHSGNGPCGSAPASEKKKDDESDDANVQDECEQLLFEGGGSNVSVPPTSSLSTTNNETDWAKIALGVAVVGGLTVAGYIVFKRFSK